MAATLKRLREPSLRDPLTGLLNGAGFATWREAHRDAERGCVLLALELDGMRRSAAGSAMPPAMPPWPRSAAGWRVASGSATAPCAATSTPS
jgi:hypothetical protein